MFCTLVLFLIVQSLSISLPPSLTLFLSLPPSLSLSHFSLSLSLSSTDTHTHRPTTRIMTTDINSTHKYNYTNITLKREARMFETLTEFSSPLHVCTIIIITSFTTYIVHMYVHVHVHAQVCIQVTYNYYTGTCITIHIKKNYS